MKFTGNNLKTNGNKAEYLSQCDAIKSKTCASFIDGVHSNQGKSISFRQFVSAAGCTCVRSFMLVQLCKPRILNFWPKFTFLLERQMKFVLTLFWTGSGRTLYWTGGGKKSPRVNSAI